ncbi:peroxisomal bifunctional enzyme [Solea senegalensis]|uniref:Peroxisomal bifunctional enzyme n=1 Tax=Solea senegalensis TaxID=28829 RepID=A0AAV6RBA0_SOLSE|nr:peroxisomal bifunctional enzyme isoform X1 [Solea senegalensis]XP_043875732.1 peroxisomal bifunctional enzyme isoform X2 [Solea senegalensis]KAG7501552.1 peroxisomal bifunctional enzyme [Solea senegalensis]KAG7501553.1 peroxisomal bifunctional enzyme [Solea senegalensis]
MAQFTLVSGSVGLITLQNPPVNALSAATRQGIVDMMNKALNDPEVKSVVVCGQNRIFCGGADIKEFGTKISGPPLIPTIHTIEATNKPVVAAIEGSALGGGLELALGCHYRIAHSKARLGLPEVTLGLLPAIGGSQRLPRLIGVPAAIELITTGRHITAAEALQLGLVDHVTRSSTVDEAIKFAQSVEGKSLDSRRISNYPCPHLPDLDAVFEGVMQEVRQKAHGAIAPIACVQAVRAAATLPYLEGMEIERQLMETLFTSSQARALQYTFFAQRAVSRWSMPSGARWDTSMPKPVHKAAVIGLGTMGRGITVALAQAGLSVVAVETQEKQLKEAKLVVSGILERAAQRRGMAPTLAKITYSHDIRAVADVDLVIEAVFEDEALKEKVFQQLSAVCKPGTFLCTNTSSLDVDHLASLTHNPELVVGMHFFAPAHVMKLLEVVYGSKSSPEALATVMQLGKRMGKVSVAVGNCWGFVGNRMLKPYMEQAFYLLEEGATPELVDQALVEFGFPMGVFRMSDLSGTDVYWKIRKEAEPVGASGQEARVRKGLRYSPLGDLLCEQGRFGQKTGQGWYQYDKPGSRVARPDPWVHNFLEEYRARHGLVARRIDHAEVLERCLYSLINEGFRILEEGIAAGPEDIDMIYVFGYGWPKHRGGPMFYASMVGLAKILERLEHYHRAHPDVPFMQPCSLLRKLVTCGSPPVHKWKDVIKKIHSQL